MSDDEDDRRITDEEVYRDSGVAYRQRQPHQNDLLAGAEPAMSAVIVGQWRCGFCGVLVDVTEAALDTLAVMNRMLARQGGDQIDPNECVWCDACRPKRDQKRVAAQLKHRATQAEMLSRLRSLNTPTHLLGEAEDWVSSKVNDGKAIIAHWAQKRAKAKASARGGI
jgi:hypothetical protein